MLPFECASHKIAEIPIPGPAPPRFAAGEPGGTINIVTKKPSFNAHHAAEVGLGSRGLRPTVDSTGALGAKVACRVNPMTEEGVVTRLKVDLKSIDLQASRHRAGDAATAIIGASPPRRFC